MTADENIKSCELQQLLLTRSNVTDFTHFSFPISKASAPQNIRSMTPSDVVVCKPSPLPLNGQTRSSLVDDTNGDSSSESWSPAAHEHGRWALHCRANSMYPPRSPSMWCTFVFCILSLTILLQCFEMFVPSFCVFPIGNKHYQY